MGNIDGFRLFGEKRSSGELYDLGWVQIDRANLLDAAKREQALAHLQRFAVGRTFTDGDDSTNLRYAWGHTHDNTTGETTYFEIPAAVNHEGKVEQTPAPADETVEQFIADAIALVSAAA